MNDLDINTITRAAERGREILAERVKELVDSVTPTELRDARAILRLRLRTAVVHAASRGMRYLDTRAVGEMIQGRDGRQGPIHVSEREVAAVYKAAVEIGLEANLSFIPPYPISIRISLPK